MPGTWHGTSLDRMVFGFEITDTVPLHLYTECALI
jgi:hypothetical protein